MLTSDLYSLFQTDVRRFMTVMDQARDSYPERELLDLRWRLIEEEMKELRDEIVTYQESSEKGELISPANAMQIMKELTDLEYVVAGYGVAFGFPIVPVIEREVCFVNTYGFRAKRTINRAWEDLETAVQGAYIVNKKGIELCEPNSTVTPQTVYIEFQNAFAYLTERIINFAEACGIDLAQTFMAVQESNMSKLGDDGKPIYREDGKVLKGPNYHKPDMSVFLEGRTDIAE